MNIAIVGAGIGGMTAAYDLNKKGHQVTLFEENDTDNSSPTASTASSTKNPKKSDPKKLKLDRMESKYLGNDSTLVTVYLKSSDINDKDLQSFVKSVKFADDVSEAYDKAKEVSSDDLKIH